MEVGREQAETWAEWFAALADPTRILILNVLAREQRPLAVGEIVERVDVGQSTVSHHLRLLSDTCFVVVESVGTSNRYRINERCLACFPSAAELVMGRGPSSAPWVDEPTDGASAGRGGGRRRGPRTGRRRTRSSP